MRTIAEIAAEIEIEWAKSKSGVHYTARPYLSAMHNLSDKRSRFFEDDAKSVVLYFLSNSASYRGPVAKAHKAELREIIK